MNDDFNKILINFKPTNGYDLCALALKKYGIKNIYGVIGIPVTQLSRSAIEAGIRFIAFHNEQAASIAASGSGFLTGFPGIALTVSGPGMINGISGLANATINCFPMILISGSSDANQIDLGQGDYQALDQMAVAKPVAKAVYRINRVEDMARGIIRAIQTSTSGRPGGVYLDIPAKVLHQSLDGLDIAALLPDFNAEFLPTLPSEEKISDALNLLKNSKKPLIIVGKGASYAKAEIELLAFIEKSAIPFLTMPMARGIITDNHPLCTNAARSLALSEADTILVIGARLNWLLKNGNFNESYKLIQIDIQPDEFDTYRKCDVPILADIKSALTKLTIGISKCNSVDWLNSLNLKIKENKEKLLAKISIPTTPMNFGCALYTINTIISNYKDLVYVTEGANTLDFGRSIITHTQPRQRLDTGTWGTMGVGLGYAIAAATTTGKQVIAVEGDAAFGFSGMEVETIIRYKLPIVVIIFNNGGIYKGDAINKYSEDPDPTRFQNNINYELISQAFGCNQNFITHSTEELQNALNKALLSKSPALINCIIDPTAGTESGHLSKMN